ncbi:MAG: S-methyl-5'-thioadenosine phosphorylase [Kiritimatiellia bacterium]
MIKLGVIGGSGLYELAGLQNISTRVLDTPFGKPSDAYVCGTLDGHELYFLPRHGRGHRLLPSEIPHRANIFGFKLLGVDAVVSVSAVGSLREEIRPRDVVLPDQYYDRTKSRDEHTFFGNGIVAHVQFGDPSCDMFRSTVGEVVWALLKEERSESRLYDRGTYVNMEGPAFSTRAESNTYRENGFDVIGMTSLAEAKLCREAELCYQSIALVTDYDCWHATAEAVSVEMIIGHLTANVELARKILARLCPAMAKSKKACTCKESLKYAIMTAPDAISVETKKRLAPIIGKYVKD